MSERRSALLLSTFNRWLRQPSRDAESDAALLERYARGRDEAAFAHLAERHGPAVLGVCRRILSDHGLAEDAFQATFLLLAQKAAALKQPDRLAGWLHGVAVKVAHRARSRQRPTAELLDQEAQTEPDPARREALRILDEELSKLAEAQRLPLILCYLEGLTHLEAAKRLGWPSGSMSWRVERAKAALHERLLRRGVVLPAAGMALLLTLPATEAAAGMPPALAAQAARLASFVTLGQGVGAGVVQLAAETSLPTGSGVSLFGKASLAAVLLLATAGLGWSLLAAAAEEPKPNERAAGQAAAAPTALPAGASARLGSTAFRNQLPSYLIASRFSADGKTLEGITASGEIERWEFPSGKPLGFERKLPETKRVLRLTGLDFQSGRLARGDGDEVVIADLDSGKELSRIRLGAPVDAMRTVALCDGGKTFAVAIGSLPGPRSDDPAHDYDEVTLDLYDAATGKLRFAIPFPMGTSRLHPIEGGRKLIAETWGQARRRLFLIDPEAGTKSELHPPAEKQQFAFHPKKPVALAMHHEGGPGAWKARYLLWNWRTSETKEFAKVPADDAWAYGIQFVGDDRLLWQTQEGDTVLWNAERGAEELRLKIGRSVMGAVEGFSPDGRYLILRLFNAGFVVFDLQEQRLQAAADGHLDAVTKLFFPADGRSLVSGSNLSTNLWDTAERRLRAALKDDVRWPSQLMLLPDGRHLLNYANDERMDLTDLQTRKLLDPNNLSPELKQELEYAKNALRFVNDGQGRWVDKAPSGFSILNFKTGKETNFRLGNEETRSWFAEALDPSGRWCLFVRRDPSGHLGYGAAASAAELILFDLKSRSVAQRWPAAGSAMERQVKAAFSADGSRLALVQGGVLRIIDPATFKALAEHAVGEPVAALAFSRDGKLLASGMGNGTILLWPTP